MYILLLNNALLLSVTSSAYFVFICSYINANYNDVLKYFKT